MEYFLLAIWLITCIVWAVIDSSPLAQRWIQGNVTFLPAAAAIAKAAYGAVGLKFESLSESAQEDAAIAVARSIIFHRVAIREGLSRHDAREH